MQSLCFCLRHTMWCGVLPLFQASQPLNILWFCVSECHLPQRVHWSVSCWGALLVIGNLPVQTRSPTPSPTQASGNGTCWWYARTTHARHISHVAGLLQEELFHFIFFLLSETWLGKITGYSFCILPQTGGSEVFNGCAKFVSQERFFNDRPAPSGGILAEKGTSLSFTKLAAREVTNGKCYFMLLHATACYCIY